MTAMVAFNFLQAVIIILKAIQVESGVVSKHYDNLHALLDQLQMKCMDTQVEERSLDLPLVFASDISMGDSEISMGHFSMTVNGINQFLNGIEVNASEILVQLTDMHQKDQVLLLSSVLYLESMNEVVVVGSGRNNAGRNSASVPPCLPMDLIDTSVLYFVTLVSIHKTQLRYTFKPKVLQKNSISTRN